MMVWEQFDRNEWFLLAMLIIAYGAIALVPRKVPKPYMILGLVWGFASATLFDFTIGGGTMDYYQVNDSNRYELTDFFTYLVFAPFGYFFINFYEWLNIGKRTLIYYIVGWTAIGAGLQWVAEWMHMTSYQKGYRMEYNVTVFLVVQTVTGLFYMHLRARDFRPVRRKSRA